MSEPIEAKDEQVCKPRPKDSSAWISGLKHEIPCERYNDYGCGCLWCHDCGWKLSDHAASEPTTVASDTSETAKIAAESAAEAFLRGQLLFRNNCNKRLSGINRAIIAAIKIELYEEPHE